MQAGSDTDLCNAALLAAFAPHERVQSFVPGTVLFEGGSEPNGVHILLSGDIDLQFLVRKADKSVCFNVAGQILGLSSIVSGRPHEYTAMALTPVLTGFIDRGIFLGTLHQSPKLWFDVLQVLSRDINSCYDRVKSLVSRRH
jgi:CRP-like cAMP-binding protein